MLIRQAITFGILQNRPEAIWTLKDLLNTAKDVE
jgi:hypothetical protein